MKLSKRFKPAWWLRNSHLQTLWPFVFHKNIKINTRKEKFELSDGDFLNLEWVGVNNNAPIVMILHGLEGSIRSAYAGGLMAAIESMGWRGLFIHFRSCGFEMNRLPRFYHSGDTQDLAEVVASLCKSQPNIPLAAVGYSLGGNVLLKWLGETGGSNPLAAAVAISVPFELQISAKKINKGLARLYQSYFLKKLRRKVKLKFATNEFGWDVPDAAKLRSMYDFDDLVTAPLHGFLSADDYYLQSSCKQWLKSIEIPTLLIHAKDDPMMVKETIPTMSDLSKSIKFELTDKGGHVGFVSGGAPWRPEYWLEQKIPAFLDKFFK